MRRTDNRPPQQLEMLPATNPSSGILGLRVQFDLNSPRFCPACGWHSLKIGGAVGPHANELRCTACNRHAGWLSKPAAARMTEMVAMAGRPTTPFIVRRKDLGHSLGVSALASTASERD
jgi:hypothetical protein